MMASVRLNLLTHHLLLPMLPGRRILHKIHRPHLVGRRLPYGTPQGSVSVAVCSEPLRRNPKKPEALVQTGCAVAGVAAVAAMPV
jgi:hypothetical protein